MLVQLNQFYSKDVKTILINVVEYGLIAIFSMIYIR